MARVRCVNIIWLLFFVLIFSYLLYNSFSSLDNDLGWHLKAGEETYNTKSVPSYDNYDYVLAGRKWVDLEWLLNLISYIIYSRFGYVVLTSVFACLVILVFLILLLFYKREYLKEKIGGDGYLMALMLLGLIGMLPHLGVRMQEATVLFFTLLLIIIYYYEKNGNQRILLFLPALFYTWANMHGGFLIGFFTLGVWVIIKIIEKYLHRTPYFNFIDTSHAASNKKIMIAVIYSFVSFIITFLTPYGFTLYSFLSEYANTVYQVKIAEWLPFYYLPIKYWQLLYASLIASMLAINLASIKYKIKDENGQNQKINLWEMVLAIIFLILAFKSKRHFPLFFIASLPFALGFFQRFIFLPVSWRNYFKGNKFIFTYLVLALIMLSMANIFKTRINNSPFAPDAPYCSYYPCAALKFIRHNGDYSRLKIFNDYNWGGYMIWTWPEKKLFIDGRLPQYSVNGHSFIEEYLEFSEADKSRQKLDEYGVGLVLLSKPKETRLNWIEKYIFLMDQEEINKKIRDNKLIHFLDSADNWRQIYSDDIAVVYARI